MTKSELDTLDSCFLAPLALFLNQYFGTIFSERKLLWICWVSERKIVKITTLRVKSTIEPQVFAFANFFSRQKRL